MSTGVAAAPTHTRGPVSPMRCAPDFKDGPCTPKAVPMTPNSRRVPPSSHNASPSPLLLNPINDEDWRAAPSRNPLLCPTLPVSTGSPDRRVRSLIAGYDVMFGHGRQRFPVRISLLGDSTALFVSFYGGVDYTAHYDDGHKHQLYPFTIPLFMLRRVYSADSFKQNDHWFGVAYCDNGHHEFERTLNFIAPTASERDSIVDAIHSLIITPTGANSSSGMTPILRQRKSPVQDYSSDPDTLSPVSFTDEPASSLSTEAKSPDSRAALVYPISSTSLVPNNNTEYTHQLTHRSRQDTTVETYQEHNLNHLRSADADESLREDCNDASFDNNVSIATGTEVADGEDNSVADPAGTLAAVPNDDNLVEGNWCSDDICAAALMDLSTTFQGIFDGSAAVSDPRAATAPDSKKSHRLQAEMYITDVLGSDFCDFEEPIIAQFAKVSPAKLTSRVKNRIERKCGPRERWQRLRNDMTFACAEEEIEWKMTSVDDSQVNLCVTATSNSRFMDASSFIGKLLGDMSIEDSLKTATSAGQTDDDYYYDSDPESVRLRSKWKTKGQKRRQSSMRIPDRLCGVRMEEEDVLEVVELIKTTLMTLLYHPTPTAENPCPRPTCVDAWIERGSYLGDQSYLQPKFMWKPAVERHLRTKKLNLALEDPERIDLLEIKRVHDSLESPLRRSYPFAIHDATFAVETRQRYYVFQARTVSEKRHIVFGLKLVVARLASLLMVRDDRAIAEWFEPVTVSDLVEPEAEEEECDQDIDQDGYDGDDGEDRYS